MKNSEKKLQTPKTLGPICWPHTTVTALELEVRPRICEQTGACWDATPYALSRSLVNKIRSRYVLLTREKVWVNFRNYRSIA